MKISYNLIFENEEEKVLRQWHQGITLLFDFELQNESKFGNK